MARSRTTTEPAADPARRRALALGGLGAVWLFRGSARAAGLGEARSITIGETELARLVEQRFPFEWRVPDLADARATQPRLRLLPQANRLVLDVQMQLTERVLGTAYRGQMVFDAGLRYDAADPAVRLVQARVRSFRFDSLPGEFAASVNRIGRELAEQMLEGQPVYRPRAEDLKTAELLGYRPGAITVLAGGVRIALEPL